MRRIRIVQFGARVSVGVGNLVTVLERVQDQYKFELSTRTIIPDPSKCQHGVYPEEYLFELIRTYMSENNFDEYPIGICDFRLPENLMSMNDEHEALISTCGWDTFSKYPVEKGLEYLIASMLIDVHQTTTLSHQDTRGCPSDFCEELSDIDKGIKAGEYCPNCRDILFSAVELGQRNHSELTAVYRILDHIAGRKICFVIMPFDRRFNTIYQAIQSCVTSRSFQCIRSDKIFQTRSVMNIVNEMIARSEIVIADLTDRNPNVLYELGYAHALGKNSILIAQKARDIPFDLRHRQYFTYTSGRGSVATLSKKLAEYFT